MIGMIAFTKLGHQITRSGGFILTVFQRSTSLTHTFRAKRQGDILDSRLNETEQAVLLLEELTLLEFAPELAKWIRKLDSSCL